MFKTDFHSLSQLPRCIFIQVAEAFSGDSNGGIKPGLVAINIPKHTNPENGHDYTNAQIVHFPYRFQAVGYLLLQEFENPASLNLITDIGGEFMTVPQIAAEVRQIKKDTQHKLLTIGAFEYAFKL